MTKQLAAAAAFLIAIAAAPAAAQTAQGEVHGNYQRGTSTHANAWGAGAQVQLTFGASNAPVRLGASLGPDFVKQDDGGPGSASVGLDLTLQTGGPGSLTPYVGGGVASNWSLGDNKAFEGAKLGTDLIGGVQVKLEPQGSLSLKAEERFGYVSGQEHTLSTRFGVQMSF